ncbi:PHP domain-containing protein [Angustibacter luteus]|uniref:PHP domain-containing protein n=1 Tax=Angustibacter luteus TaxID=658456 RepID=A0ABW1JHC6_9ACTN
MTRGREDFHVHTSGFSDDAHSPLADVLAAAVAAELDVVCLAEHVRASTTWLPDYLQAVQEARPQHPGLRILRSVETKILDTTGALDLPPGTEALDAVHLADHQFPLDHPTHPDDVREQLRDGRLSVDDAVTALLDATCAAMGRVAQPVLAHLFSVLPKVGLSEQDVPGAALGELAHVAARTHAVLEVNQKWACPSARTIAAFATAGVPLVASTDAHEAAEVGRWSMLDRLPHNGSPAPDSSGC